MALDAAAMPNLKNLDPAFLKPSYDPTGQFHVIKDYGITMFFFMNTVVKDSPKSMLDFYNLLPKYGSKGRTNVLDGAEEVVPLALMALGLDPNTTSSSDFAKVKSFLLKIRPGVTTIDSSGYINDAIAGKIILEPGLERRRAPHRAGAQEAGRHHRRHPHRGVRGVGRQLVRPRERAAPGRRPRLDQLAARAGDGRGGDELPQLPDPDPGGAGADAAGAEERPALQRARRSTPTTTTTSST